jgi:predicted secreted hydrolase
MKRLLLFLAFFVIIAPGYAFDRALPGYQYRFPRDHFNHPNFQVEWWYYTGNVQTAEGRAFGFELTFFRLGVDNTGQASLPATWEPDHLYLAHLALSDIEGRQFYTAERLNRAGPGLAGVSLERARVWNGNWQVLWVQPENPKGRQQLRAVAEDFSLDLNLTPLKPAVIHGENGIDQKAAGAGRASHYISFTRLAAEGHIGLDDKTFAVTGTAWMDHEFSTDSMGPGQAGWDWLSIQLNNNTEFMLYRMRRADGSADPHSSGTFVDAEGRTRHLDWNEIVMEPGREIWESPGTGGKYPIQWNVKVPSLGLELDCRTPFPGQEIFSNRKVSPTYWEGSVRFRGRMGSAEVSGAGYLEMTGYDKPIQLGSRKEE